MKLRDTYRDFLGTTQPATNQIIEKLIALLPSTNHIVVKLIESAVAHCTICTALGAQKLCTYVLGVLWCTQYVRAIRKLGICIAIYVLHAYQSTATKYSK